MSLNDNYQYSFTNHKEVAHNINKESAALYELLCVYYQNFNSWLNSHSVNFKPLVVSSYGYRRLSTDHKGGAHYEGLAIDIARPNLTTTPLRYIALFGFYLQKNCNSIHTSISMHNKHIHIDILPSRKGQKNVEYKKDDASGYYFRTIDKASTEQIFKDYEFDDTFKNLYYQLNGGGSEINQAGFGVVGILLLLLLLGLILGGRQ